ncbi:MAG: chloride channel protein [Deltaproteobacteria bacterium]|nr:chloride channel protein [Deltaproteobacteria bacterium]
MKEPHPVRYVRNPLLALFRRLRISDHTFLIILAIIIGGVVGGGTVFFVKLLEGSDRLFRHFLPGLLGGHLWVVALVPAFGGLCLAPFIWRFPKEAARDGVPATMEAVALHNGLIRWRDGFLTMILSAITLGSGGSAGSEGPIIRIGSAFASGVGQFLGVSGERRRVIAACGAGAGLAAIFNAPIAGVMFAIEAVLGEFNVRSFSPVIISAVLATAVARAFLSRGALLHVPPYQLFSHWEIPLYAIMGIAAGFVSIAFTRMMLVSERFFQGPAKIPVALTPAVGGLLVGIIGGFLPQILGYSYVPLTKAINGQFAAGFLFLLAAAKMVATSLTLGSRGSGGILCPSLFLGATFGSGCGTLFHGLFPHLLPQVGGYGIVGMGAMLGAVLQAPMAAMVMGFEITDDYRVILPMMAACILATLIHKKFMKGSLYSLKLAHKGIHIDAGREMGILSDLRVREIMEPVFETIPVATAYEVVLEKCLGNRANCLYVVDEKENLVGVVSFSNLKQLALEGKNGKHPDAKDLLNPDVVCVTPDESLASCLHKFSFIDMEQLPVVDQNNAFRKISGVITKSHVFEAYRQEMVKRSMRQG